MIKLHQAYNVKLHVGNVWCHWK